VTIVRARGKIRSFRQNASAPAMRVEARWRGGAWRSGSIHEAIDLAVTLAERLEAGFAAMPQIVAFARPMTLG